ncbi:hypothetical protein J2D73_10725 [Acetobacter sacchari]|uniref:Uncharacterized protein n=1 Tax=Acetobacter sacchari TaxID=2661687 RepID=A0ABS3LWG9_9PROT|nr:hypothetical protein [Acetobacter sacchari]MBO1360260.1 hypothetical protein [Acetobacter sacchari]
MKTPSRARGVSLRKLHDIEADDLAVSDVRPTELDALTAVPEDVLHIISDVFSGTNVAADASKVKAILDAQRAVKVAWERAARSFLEIGRALNSLDARLISREEKLSLKAGFDKLFPFSEPVASQFRRVAAAVDTGRLDESSLPGSYSAAYQLSLLEPDQLDTARKRGLVAPNASRSAIIAFRKSVDKSTTGVDFSGLMAEARRLKATRRRMLIELLAIRKREREISAILNAD